MDRFGRSSRSTVMKSKSIGTAVGLALCIAALPACSKASNNSSQPASNSAAPGTTLQVQWNSKLKKQLLEIIANAPANGLKPGLFLHGNEDDDGALTQAALKYAEALSNG